MTENWEKIRQAARIADEAFGYILGEIRPGVSEKEIAWLLEKTDERIRSFRALFRYDLRFRNPFVHAACSSYR